MERVSKTKQRNAKKNSFEQRSPLQDLNRALPIRKQTTRKSLNLSHSSSSSSSAAAVSSEAPKGCLRFLPSSNSCSSSSTSCSKVNNEPKRSTKSSRVLPRSKENEVPKKPFLQKSKGNPSNCLTRRQNGETNKKSICKSTQRSKISSVQGNPVKKSSKGSQNFQAKTKNSVENCSGERTFELIGVSDSRNSNSVKNLTPLEGIASGRGLDSVMDDSIYERGNCGSANAVKTPPLEASLSPDIQTQSHSKMMALKSAATPVCYGAGHLLSGVTDKRKCRRRGSLKGGFEKTHLFFDDEMKNEKVINDLQDCSIPLPAEASVRWMLSPCKEMREDDPGSDSRNRCNAAGTLDYLSSPSIVCGNESDLLCADSNCSGSRSVGNVAKKMRSRNVIGDKSRLSIGSLNSGNIIQTPNSESTSDACIVRSEVKLITETIKRVNLLASPQSPVDPAQIEDNMDSVSSWALDTVLSDNLGLSRMRISWRDGLVSRIVENDEFDCQCCLSDEEETDAYGSRMLYPLFESGENQENDSIMDKNLSPVLLDYEPCISARGKDKLLSDQANACAESICTDGGGLAASDDSDWIYCHENKLFTVR